MRLNSFILIIFLLVVGAAGAKGLKGELSILGSGSQYDSNSIMSQDSDGKLDASTDLRLMYSTDVTLKISIFVDYVNNYSGGDTERSASKLGGYASTYASHPPTDSTQLFDMSATYIDDDGSVGYHRIDRLFVEYATPDANIRLGRQVVTWGHGKVFNPVDIVNPFAPSDVFRDYKSGSDMAVVQSYFDFVGDVQLVAVPRRDEDTHSLRSDESTFAVKISKNISETDIELYAGDHYETVFAGVGVAANLMDTGIRGDIVFNEEYYAAVANIDYSWVMFEKNTYWYFELFYNDLGEDNYADASASEVLTDMLNRGEVYLYGKMYAATGLQVELHPLVNMYGSVIYNMHDSSALFQPRAVWELSDALELTAGLNLPLGSTGTEFDGYYDSSDEQDIDTPDQIYLKLTFFF